MAVHFPYTTLADFVMIIRIVIDDLVDGVREGHPCAVLYTAGPRDHAARWRKRFGHETQGAQNGNPLYKHPTKHSGDKKATKTSIAIASSGAASS